MNIEDYKIYKQLYIDEKIGPKYIENVISKILSLSASSTDKINNLTLLPKKSPSFRRKNPPPLGGGRFKKKGWESKVVDSNNTMYRLYIVEGK